MEFYSYHIQGILNPFKTFSADVVTNFIVDSRKHLSFMETQIKKAAYKNLFDIDSELCILTNWTDGHQVESPQFVESEMAGRNDRDYVRISDIKYVNLTVRDENRI